MIPDIVEIKRLCASGQWLARIENGKILLHDTVAGETVCIGQTGAEPVRHGRWEWYEDWGPSTWLEPPDLNKAGWKCSNCGIDLGDYLTDCLGVTVYVDEEDKMPKIKSCPHCGAKMDGGDPHD